MARLARGWTQEQLARQAGLSKACISHFELGRREPRVRTATALARALEIELGELIPSDW